MAHQIVKRFEKQTSPYQVCFEENAMKMRKSSMRPT
jgi:hypothetical protein